MQPEEEAGVALHPSWGPSPSSTLPHGCRVGVGALHAPPLFLQVPLPGSLPPFHLPAQLALLASPGPKRRKFTFKAHLKQPVREHFYCFFHGPRLLGLPVGALWGAQRGACVHGRQQGSGLKLGWHGAHSRRHGWAQPFSIWKQGSGNQSKGQTGRWPNSHGVLQMD